MTPNSALHDPRPEYLRALVQKSGLSQRQAADRIGISRRLLTYYLTSPKPGRESRIAPYPVQFALESLAASEALSNDALAKRIQNSL